MLHRSVRGLHSTLVPYGVGIEKGTKACQLALGSIPVKPQSRLRLIRLPSHRSTSHPANSLPACVQLFTCSHLLGRYAAHAGSKLTPPVGDEARMRELGPLLPTDVRVRGDSFRVSGTDVAIAGLGWIAVAVDGATDLRWAHVPLYLHFH